MLYGRLSSSLRWPSDLLRKRVEAGGERNGSCVWRPSDRHRASRIAPRYRADRCRTQSLRFAGFPFAASRPRGQQGRFAAGDMGRPDRFGIGADHADQCGAPGPGRRRLGTTADPHLHPQGRSLHRHRHGDAGSIGDRPKAGQSMPTLAWVPTSLRLRSCRFRT